MAGPSFFQRPIPNFGPSGGGRRYVAGTPISGPRGGGVRRLRYPGMSYTSIENRYVVGSGVGSTNAAARRALRRRASNGANGKPCGFRCSNDNYSHVSPQPRYAYSDPATSSTVAPELETPNQHANDDGDGEHYKVGVKLKTSSHSKYLSGSALAYTLNGMADVALAAKVGSILVFDVSETALYNHPIVISSGEEGGEEYDTVLEGVMGTVGAKLLIPIIDNNTSLYYHCSLHSAMGNVIAIA